MTLAAANKRAPGPLYQDAKRQVNNNNSNTAPQHNLPLPARAAQPKQQQQQHAGGCGPDSDTWSESASSGAPAADVDSGYAWIILLVVFTLNSSTFGTARTYGLIFEKLANHEELSRTEAALPFTIMGAVENMAGPVTVYVLARTQSWRATVFVGSLLIMLAHLLSGIFYTTLGQVLSLGVLGGLGLSLVSISSFQVNNAYFVRYRSTAFGIGLTGATLGTFYISPLCQHVLNLYGVRICYLVIGLMLAPNAPLALLLKPNQRPCMVVASVSQLVSSREKQGEQVATIVGPQVAGGGHRKQRRSTVWRDILAVLHAPMFHLIWLTQLLFCWFNFVYSMIIVDFGKDRALDDTQVARLIPVWALGQLAGRLLLGLLTDLKLISYRASTVLCFAAIGASTWALNNAPPPDAAYLIPALVFLLAAFISNLYILFNGLIVAYMEESRAAHTIGIASFIGSFFLLHRANVIGYYRDSFGNYDRMLTLFTWAAFGGALLWLLAPTLIAHAQQLSQRRRAAKQGPLKVHLPAQPALFATSLCHPGADPLKAPRDVFF